MLAMTFAEKGCLEHGLCVGEGSRSKTKAQIREHLAAHLNDVVWAALAPKLAI